MTRNELRKLRNFIADAWIGYATEAELEIYCANGVIFERFGKAWDEVLSASDLLSDEVRNRFLEACREFSSLFSPEMKDEHTAVSMELECARRCLSEGIT